MTTHIQHLTTPLRAHGRNGSPTDQRPDLLSRWLQWRPVTQRDRHVLSVAELAECTCPDLCNRDHPNE